MKLVKKIVLPLVFVAFALAAVLLVAFATIKGGTPFPGVTETVYNIVFGANKAVLTDGVHTGTETLNYGPSVLLLIGWILIALGLVCGAIVAFLGEKLFKNNKVAMMAALGVAALVLVGGVFQFFALSSFTRASYEAVGGISYEDLYDTLKEYGWNSIGCTLGGVFSIVAALALAVRGFLPEKK